MRTMTTTMMRRMTGLALVAGLLHPGPLVGQSAAEARAAQAEKAAAMKAAQLRQAEKAAAGSAVQMRQAQVAAAMAKEELAQARALGGVEMIAPAPWVQEDPGAKAYAKAREALNARKYREAAGAFEELRKAYPKSVYVADSYYYQAFALSRLSDRASLERAAKLLAEQSAAHPGAGTRRDADELRVRIEGQMARRGDAQAAEAIARQAADPCKDEESGVRAAALSALLTMRTEAALPLLKEVLQRRDACSAELRRHAVFLISQKMDAESVDILLDLAHRNPDPDPEVREQAVFWLSQVQSEEAVKALQAILSGSKDPELQERALFALSQQKSPSAMGVLRAYAERGDAPAEARLNALFWIGQSGGGGGAQYLMQLYPKLEDSELKERAMLGIAQSGSQEAREWLEARARDPKESMEVRKHALFWAGQAGGLSVDVLRDIYRSQSDLEMKEQVIFVVSQKEAREAVDFLMEVARNEKDPELQEKAIFWLGQSKDPRVAEFLLSLIRG